MTTKEPVGPRARFAPDHRASAAAILIVAALVAGALVVVTGFAAAPPAGAATPSSSSGAPVAAGTISTFGHGLTGNQGMAAGPDGNMWFGTDRGFGRITPSGSITVFPGVKPRQLAAGPDGTIWFTSASGVGRITTSGVIALFPGALPGVHITAGGDGAMWTSTPSSINRITPDGAITTFSDPAMTDVSRLVWGADGNIWCNHGTTHAIGGVHGIGRLSPAGVFTMFPDDRLENEDGIALGSDGNVWVTAYTPTMQGGPFVPPTPQKPWVVSITPAGTMTFFSGGDYPSLITAGPNGDLWLANQGESERNTPPTSLARVTTAGTMTTYPGEPGRVLPTTLPLTVTYTGFINGLAKGPDGSAWYVSSASNSVNRMTPDGSLTSFRGTDVNHPTGIAIGPNGDASFANNGTDSNYPPIDSRAGSLGRSTPGGTISSNRSPKVARPDGVTRAPDGAMWFTDSDIGGVVRVDGSGTVTSFPTNDGSAAAGITTGADGNVWIADRWSNGVERITPGGVATRFVLPTTQTPQGIVGGPDGNVWFATGTNSIGRITPAGAITIFDSPRTDLRPNRITSGPDGNLWFTSTVADATANAIGRLTTTGTFTYFADRALRDPRGIASGPDGNVWFSNANVAGSAHAGAIGRITGTGAITWFASPEVSEAQDLVAGTTGDLWFTLKQQSALGRITAVDPGAPGAPAFPSATSRSDGAQIGWWPSAPGVGVTGGMITPYLNGVALAPTSFTGTSASQLVHGLTAGLTYTFRISLTNASGTGPPSPMTAPVLVGRPNAPAFPTATVTSGGVTVSWWSQPVTGATITPYLSGVAQTPVPFSGQRSSALVTGLPAGSSATFTVTLTNAYGTSPPSAPTNPVTVGVPVVAFPSASAGATGVTVYWWAQPVTGGTVTPYLGGVAQAPIPFSGQRSSVLITGLVVGQTYRFTITLTNAYGTGPPSALTAPVVVTA
jgi:streptogramin lyase